MGIARINWEGGSFTQQRLQVGSMVRFRPPPCWLGPMAGFGLDKCSVDDKSLGIWGGSRLALLSGVCWLNQACALQSWTVRC